MHSRNAPLGDASIYLVEDDEAVCDSLGVILEFQGATVTRLANLSDTRAALAFHQPDCMLIDINLPDGTGWDLLTEFRNNNVLIPAIMITGMMQHQYLDLAKLMEVDILEKPLDGDDLAAQVESLFFRSGRIM